MNCPHCGGDLDLPACPECGAETLPAARFCCQCGSKLEVDVPPDLADRVLCPDGACIGILDDQKKCSVCGFAYQEVIAAEQAHG